MKTFIQKYTVLEPSLDSDLVNINVVFCGKAVGKKTGELKQVMPTGGQICPVAIPLSKMSELRSLANNKYIFIHGLLDTQYIHYDEENQFNIAPFKCKHANDGKLASLTKECFSWESGAMVSLLIDYDAPKADRQAVGHSGVVDDLPELLNKITGKNIEMHIAPSSSSCINGKNPSGIHINVPVKACDAKEIADRLFNLLCIDGYARLELSKAGTHLKRTLIDIMPVRPEAADYIYRRLLKNEQQDFEPHERYCAGDILSLADLPMADPFDWQELQNEIEPVKATVVESYADNLEQSLIDAGVPVVDAKTSGARFKAMIDGDKPHELHAMFTLFNDKGEPFTLDDVKNGKRKEIDIYDPFEGTDYHLCAKLYFNRGNGCVAVHSMAHGGIKYIYPDVKLGVSRDSNMTLPIGAEIPFGYKCTEKGVYAEGTKTLPNGEKTSTKTWITNTPCFVSAMSRDGNDNNWGRMFHWLSLDGANHKCAIPAVMFTGAAVDLQKQLLSEGLDIVPRQMPELIRYICKFTTPKRMTSVSQCGWFGDTYVLPNFIVNPPPDSELVYQPTELNLDKSIYQSGTLKDWQQGMLDASDPVVVSVCVSLSGAALRKTNMPLSGLHWSGSTSRGKTTVLQAAASVWGNGTDPREGAGSKTNVRTFNATGNGLEGVCQARNDSCLTLDELGQLDPSILGKLIYSILGGVGKQRANQSGGLQHSREWILTLLSSGEMSVADFIEGAYKGGQAVRLVDVPMPNAFDSAEQADAMKVLCANHFGTAGIAFIQSGNISIGWADFDVTVIGAAKKAEHIRVRKTFALYAYIGELAISRGVLPWSKGRAIEACARIYDLWLNNSAGSCEADRGIENVRTFVFSYGSSRFEHEDCRERAPIDRAGWFRNNIYHFTDAGFKEACRGISDGVVRKALRDEQLLHMSDSARLKSQIMVNGERVRVTSIYAAILTANDG